MSVIISLQRIIQIRAGTPHIINRIQFVRIPSAAGTEGLDSRTPIVE